MADAATNAGENEIEGRSRAVALNPMAYFRKPSREIDTLFDNFWRTPSVFDRPLFTRSEISAPVVDVAQHDKDYEVTAELPGLDAADIDVKFTHDMLTISAKRRKRRKKKKKDYYLSERKYGSFQRSFRLPDGIDADKIEAKFDKGVLKVALPKTLRGSVPREENCGEIEISCRSAPRAPNAGPPNWRPGIFSWRDV